MMYYHATLLLGVVYPTATLLDVADGLPQARRIPDILAQIQKQHDGKEHTMGAHSLSPLHENDVPEDDATTDDVDVLSFDQILDHFSTDGEQDGNTFKQRYFYTSRYVKQSDDNDGKNLKRPTAAFLCVGGEGPSMDASALTNSVHCTGDMIELADKLFSEFDWNIHLFALEHRYYGESMPGIKNNNIYVEDIPGYLRGNNDSADDDEKANVDFTYLSSRQAVKDIANFVQSREAKTHFDLDDDAAAADHVRWITFGGSYPGMLSAWSRLLHPDVIHGSVSNSSPVQAKLDFQEYHERVGYDLAYEFIGGSVECRRIVLEGHAQAVEILDAVDGIEGDGQGSDDNDGLDTLATLFNVCGGADSLRASRRNREVFVGDGLIGIPAQSNDPSCEEDLCNIKGVCEAIIKEQMSEPSQSSMEILAKISNMQSGGCINVDYQQYIDYFGTSTVENSNDRSWLYQTCNEFGFYQTCNVNSECPYGKGYHDVSRDLEECQMWYGISPEDVAKNVRSSLEYYGGWDLTPANTSLSKQKEILGQSRILFVTGDVDPWTELAVTGKKGNKEHPTFSVKGASHHFWTHEIEDADGIEIDTARSVIYNTVFEWLWSTNDYETHESSVA